jgi:N-formylglutamate amidohydrolase
VKKYVKVIHGNFPLLITVPHGGYLKPKNIPDRKKGVMGADKNTAQVAEALMKALAKIGCKPYFVILNISRDKVDANRPRREAYESEEGRLIYEEYHEQIQASINELRRRYGKAFIIDIHGQSHQENRIEIGYCLKKNQLSEVRGGEKEKCSILHTSIKDDEAALIFGEKSLGEELLKIGYDATPRHNKSPKNKESYFSGGYTTQKYAFEMGVRGLQLELNYLGIRDAESNINKFAKRFASVLVEYLNNLGYTNEEKVNFIGYGSLMSHQSLSQTIKDKHYVPVIIKGYKRVFDLRVNGGDRSDLLNVHKYPGHKMNGVMFSVSREEFEKLMSREHHYRAERVLAHDYTTGKPSGFGVLVCDHFLDIDHEGKKPDIEYFKECRRAAYLISDDFGRYWDETTYTSYGEVISKFIRRHKHYL